MHWLVKTAPENPPYVKFCLVPLRLIVVKFA